MGIGLQIYLVHDDDSVERLALTRYERLLRGDPEESLPRYAGKHVRYAEAAIEFENRKPVAIVRLLYFILHFDSKGRIDLAELEKERRLGVHMIPPLHFEHDPVVIDAKHQFAKKRYDHQYRWTPTPEIEKAILDAIFGVQQ